MKDAMRWEHSIPTNYVFFLLLARASRPPALEACGCAGTLPHIFPSVTVSLRQKMLGAAVCVCVLRWFFLSAGSEEIEESVVWLRLNAFSSSSSWWIDCVFRPWMNDAGREYDPGMKWSGGIVSNGWVRRLMSGKIKIVQSRKANFFVYSQVRAVKTWTIF